AAHVELSALARMLDPAHHRFAGCEAQNIDAPSRFTFIDADLFPKGLASVAGHHQVHLGLVIRRRKPRNRNVLSIRRNSRPVDRTTVDLPTILAETFGRRPLAVRIPRYGNVADLLIRSIA